MHLEKSARIGFGLSVFVAFGFAAFADTPSNSLFSIEDLKEDVSVAKRSLEEGDPGLYRFATKETIDAQFAKASASVTRPMTELEFYRILAPAIAAIKNGHTQLQLSDSFARQFQAEPNTLPLDVRVLDGRPYILRDLSGSESGLVGSEIVSINSMPARTIVERIEADLSLDADVRGSRDHDASGLGFGRGLSQILGLTPPFKIIATSGDRTLTATLEGVSERVFWNRLTGKEADARYGEPAGPALSPTGLTFRENGTAVLRIAHWDSVDNGGLDLSALFPTWFDELKKRKTTSLIIDIRGNGGGEETEGTDLLSHLVDKPFRYYDCVVLNNDKFNFLRYLQDDGTPYAKLLPQYAKPSQGKCSAYGAYELTNRPNLGEQQPRAPRYEGKIYLLIDAGSFSTSAEFATNLRTHAQPIIIGEESSGAYYGNDSGIVIPIALPHSKLVLQVPTVAYYVTARHDLPPNSGVVPDFPISYGVRDLLSRDDKAMAAAHALIAGMPVP